MPWKMHEHSKSGNLHTQDVRCEGVDWAAIDTDLKYLCIVKKEIELGANPKFSNLQTLSHERIQNHIMQPLP